MIDRLRMGVLLCGFAAAIACAPKAQLSVVDGTGPSPALPDPQPSLIPTVKVAPAKGWATGERPAAASETRSGGSSDHKR